MITFITRMRAKPGKRDELLASGRRMQEVTAKEPGVRIYAFHTSEEDPDEFWYYDLYESQAAYEAHGATPEFKRMSEEIGDLIEDVQAIRLVPFGPVKSLPVE